MSAQLAIAQQRVAELTPLAEEAASLRLREAEAHQHEETEKAFKDLSVRVQRDEEAAARVQKKQDELLQKNVEASQWAIDLLAELETERDLKLRAEERFAAMQQRVNLDAETIARLCRERDELCYTAERLYSEHSTICEERN